MNPVILKDVLSLKHCKLLQSRFLQTIKNNEKYVKFKDESEIILNSKALYDPYKNFKLDLVMDVNKFFNELTQKVTYVFQKNIQFTNSFIRMYKSGSDLGLHSDRTGLDITLSVNVGGLQNWPLNISNISSKEYIGIWNTKNIPKEYQKYKDSYVSYITPVGTGVLSLGKYPHWRDELVCAENEYVLQIFYHWKITN